MDMWMDVDLALANVPVNLLPLLSDADFKTRQTTIVYNSAGMDLVWNFVTTGGAYTQTAVTPTTGGVYDWAHKGDAMYCIEIPASGGASINNNTEGFGWFSGLVTGVLPFRGPVIGFRAAGLNDLLIDSAFSTTLGLTGSLLDAAISSRATPAQVNTEVVDCLNVDTYAEPGQETPGATISLAKKIGFMFKAWRNKSTQDTTDYKLFANNGTTVDQKSVRTDAAGTFTSGKIGTGP